jgi:hypothetical protein
VGTLLRVFLLWGTQEPANARVWERWYCCYTWSSACLYSVRCPLPGTTGYATKDPPRRACVDVRARARRCRATSSFYSAHALLVGPLALPSPDARPSPSSLLSRLAPLRAHPLRPRAPTCLLSMAVIAAKHVVLPVLQVLSCASVVAAPGATEW